MMLREIVLDTETTGLDCRNGDRLVEVGCIELINRIPTGREFHHYVNPERDMPAAAQAVHGLSTQFLADKPRFAEIARELIAFIAGDTLVIHNATFDVGFLNAEFERCGHPALASERIFDTLTLARRKHPGGPNSLDALCKRYAIDNSKRDKHGALIDSLLLAEVYIELLGARQTKLDLSATASGASGPQRSIGIFPAAARPKPLPPRLTAADEAAHAEFVATLGPKALWLRVTAPAE